MLRVVVLDSLYGCVQVASDVSSDGTSAAGAANPSLGIQAAGLPSGQLAVVAGGCAVVLSLHLHAPTLANLIGALAVGGAQQSSDAAASCAAAAAQALHPSDLEALAVQTGAGVRRVRWQLEAGGGASEDGDVLLEPAEVRCAGAHRLLRMAFPTSSSCAPPTWARLSAV